MTELDQSDQPAKDSEFRAIHPRTRDVVYLQQPELIKYHPDYQLQRRDENGKWDTFLFSASTSDDDAHEENVD